MVIFVISTLALNNNCCQSEIIRTKTFDRLIATYLSYAADRECCMAVHLQCSCTCVDFNRPHGYSKKTKKKIIITRLTSDIVRIKAES